MVTRFFTWHPAVAGEPGKMDYLPMLRVKPKVLPLRELSVRALKSQHIQNRVQDYSNLGMKDWTYRVKCDSGVNLTQTAIHLVKPSTKDRSVARKAVSAYYDFMSFNHGDIVSADVYALLQLIELPDLIYTHNVSALVFAPFDIAITYYSVQVENHFSKYCASCYKRFVLSYSDEENFANSFRRRKLHKCFQLHHVLYSDYLVENYIQEPSMWCSKCIFTPLFKTTEIWEPVNIEYMYNVGGCILLNKLEELNPSKEYDRFVTL